MSTGTWPDCPDCGSDATDVLREARPDARASDATLQCEDCGRVFKAVLAVAPEIDVSSIISDGPDSRRTSLRLATDARVRVGDEIFGEDHRLLLTAIEHKDGRRVRTAPADEVATLWLKVFDEVTVRIAVNRGNRTVPSELTVAPETEFLVGDELRVLGYPVEIHAIKTAAGIRYRGSAEARDIVRLYGRVRDDPLHEIAKREKAERQRAHWDRVARRRERLRQEEEGNA